VSTVEFDIDFDFMSSSRSRAEVFEDIRERMRGIPGTFSVLTGPLADRIGHMLSGVSAKVAIKVFGENLDEIRRIGSEIQAIARKIPGFEAARIEQQAPIPQMRIEINRERALAYGVTPGALNEQLSTLIGGKNVSELYEGQRTIDMVIRLPSEWRESPTRLARMPINTESGQLIPLNQIAYIRQAKGPNVIQRENTQRRFVVSINPAGRNLSGLVEQLQADVMDKVNLPEGYDISFEGEYQAQKKATGRIALLSAAVFILIAFLLYGYFKTPFFVTQVICDIQLAFIGGLAFTWIMLDNVSIATLVGLIAVAGIASRNSILLISHYLHLMRHEGEEFTRKMIERATLERLVPVLMTALATGIALIPLVLASDSPGKEILHPIAVVIVGGLLSSTLLGLGVTPAVFHAFGRRAAERSVKLKSLASE
jgi:Cu/Ag efflux pump CusA